MQSRLRLLLHGLAALTGALGAAGTAMSQCTPRWTPIGGFNGASAGSALTVWDPDGDGPRMPLLVFSGPSAVGDVPTSGVAAFDGSAWTSLGDRQFNSPPSKLVSFQSRLFGVSPGSMFLPPGPSHSAEWSGDEWIAAPWSDDLTRRTFFVDADRLLIGGRPHTNGSGSLIAYDGVETTDLGLQSSDVYDITRFNGELVVANTIGAEGARISISSDDGWRHIRAFGPSSLIYAMQEYNGELVVGGRFFSSDGAPGDSITAWNGKSWRPLGAGFAGDAITALFVRDGSLYASGSTLHTNSPTTYFTRRWNGSAWEDVDPTLDGRISAVVDFHDTSFATGDFTGSQGVVHPSLAAFDGQAFSPVVTSQRSLGLSGVIHAAGRFHDDLIVVGQFQSAGDVLAGDVARWDGSHWSPLGEGLQNTTGEGFRKQGAVAEFRGDLIVAGNFNSAGAGPISGVARWDGQSWNPLGAGFDQLDSRVTQLLSFNDRLYAVGPIRVNGQLASAAVWDGASWTSIPELYGAQRFQEFRGRLYAAVAAGGHPSGAMVLDDGRWVHVLPALPYRAASITVHDGRLVAGNFSSTVPELLGWDGAQWTPVCPAPPQPAAAYNMQLLSLRGDLYAVTGNDLYNPSSSTVMRWNGARWDTLDVLPAVIPSSAVIDRGGLLIGNLLPINSQVSAGYVRLACACPVDYDADGSVNSSDFFRFIELFFALDPHADFNSSGFVDSQDFFDYLNSFFTGCD